MTTQQATPEQIVGKLFDDLALALEPARLVMNHANGHTLGNELQNTTNVVYTSLINSMSELRKKTIKYLTEERELVINVDFYVPSDEFLQRQFSPLHELWIASTVFTAFLDAKRVMIGKTERKNNDHAHYCAAQKQAYRNYLY